MLRILTFLVDLLLVSHPNQELVTRATKKSDWQIKIVSESPSLRLKFLIFNLATGMSGICKHFETEILYNFKIKCRKHILSGYMYHNRKW